LQRKDNSYENERKRSKLLLPTSSTDKGLDEH